MILILMLLLSGDVPIIFTLIIHKRSITILAMSLVAVAVSANILLTLVGIKLLIVPISANDLRNDLPYINK